MNSVRTGRQIAIIDGVLPTNVEWKQIRRDGGGINVLRLPSQESTLDLLGSAIEWLEEVWVSSATCTELAALAGGHNLRCLLVGGEVATPVDASGLARLTAFFGPVDKFPGVLSLATLVELSCVVTDLRGSIIDAPVKKLRLDLAGTHHTPDLADPGQLVELELFASDSFDLNSLRKFESLEALRIAAVGRLDNPEALLSLQELRQLVLEQCPTIERYRSLRGLKVAQVRVIGSNPFSESFRRTVANSSAWIFPPGRRYLPPEDQSPREYLVHPGLVRPLALPQEAGESVPWADLITESWSELPANVQTSRLEALSRLMLSHAVHRQGAELRDQQGERVVEPRFLPGLTAWVGDLPLLTFQDSLEDGLIVEATLLQEMKGDLRQFG